MTFQYRKTNLFHIFLFSFFIAITSACGSEKNPNGTKAEEQTDTAIRNRFSDTNLVAIFEIADHRNIEKMLPWTQSDNPIYTRTAAHCLASYQDSLVLPLLQNLLESTDEETKRKAIFALGNQRLEGAAYILAAFKHDNPTTSLSPQLAEAWAKCAKEEDISGIIKLWTTAPAGGGEAVARILYQLTLRGIDISKHLKKISFENGSESTRFYTAHALARSKTSPGFKSIKNEFFDAVQAETNFNVLLAQVGALKHFNNDENVQAFLRDKIMASGTPTLIVVNALRALSRPSMTFSDLGETYANNNFQIASTAAAQIAKHNLAQQYPAKAKEILPKCKVESVAEILSQLLAKDPQDSELNKLAHSHFNSALSPHDRATLLKVYQNPSEANFIFITQFLNDPSLHKYLSTAAMEVFANMSKKEGGKPTVVNAEIFKQALKSNDDGQICVAAIAVLEDLDVYRPYLQDVDLDKILNKFSLPKQAEAHAEVLKLQCTLDSVPLPKQETVRKYDINWELVKSLSPKARAIVKTEKGEIKIELAVEQSPGSVGSFVALAEQGFYDNKAFHRVVPNFVLQDGCPRGDGYGGVDYTLRSDFGLNEYKTGAVGLASIGPDTESCQWFISHSPTPHLNGRYPIIGYVQQGMDIAQGIALGDKILSIKIEKE